MSFLKCKIWLVEQYPRYGTNFNLFPITGVIDYDSNNTFYDYKEDRSQHFINIMVPEFEIYATEQQIELLDKYLEIIISNKLPILKNVQKRDVESWMVDTTYLEYYLKSKKYPTGELNAK